MKTVGFLRQLNCWAHTVKAYLDTSHRLSVICMSLLLISSICSPLTAPVAIGTLFTGTVTILIALDFGETKRKVDTRNCKRAAVCLSLSLVMLMGLYGPIVSALVRYAVATVFLAWIILTIKYSNKEVVKVEAKRKERGCVSVRSVSKLFAEAVNTPLPE